MDHLKRLFLLWIWGLVITLLTVAVPVHTVWNTLKNGNPIVPGYFADPSIFYDSTSKVFYFFSTTDGVWINYSGGPQVRS
jgi:hypothetical protein